MTPAPTQTLRQALLSAGQTQRQLAVLLDVDQAQVNRWVNGTVPLRFYREAIEKHFGEELKWPSE